MNYLYFSPLFLLVFIFGSILGSFLSVIATRYNTGLSFFGGRSFCFSCNTQIQGKYLIPIFSFLFLKGRCSYCGAKIPFEVFLNEVLMGLLAILAFWKSGFLFEPVSYPILLKFVLLLAILFLILLISVYDLKHFIIPDIFLFLLFLSAIAFNLLVNTNFILWHFLVSGIALTAPFYLIFLISNGRWLGFGDIKYILVIGFLLGLGQGVSAVILAFWIGAIFSLIILTLKHFHTLFCLPIYFNNLTIKSEVPFGPFLSLGIILSIYFNADLFHIKNLLNLF